MAKREIEVAYELGEFRSDIKSILSDAQETKDFLKQHCKQNEVAFNELGERVKPLEEFKTRQTAYFAAAAFIGGIIVTLVNWVLDYWKSKGGV